MVKVIMTMHAGRKTDLFPDHTLLRQVLDEFHEGYTGTMNGKPLLPPDLYRPLRDFERDSIVELTSVPAEESVASCDDKQDSPSPVEVHDASREDKAKDVQAVITSLAKWLGQKLIRFFPLFIAAYGIVMLLLSAFGGHWNYRLMFSAVTLLLICSNLISFWHSEEKNDKVKKDSMESKKDEGSDSNAECCVQGAVFQQVDELPF